MRLDEVRATDMRRIVVSVDPAVTSGEDSDYTGIVVVARGPHVDGCSLGDGDRRCPGHGYVLDDFTARLRPQEWARRVVEAYDLYSADRVVAEVNNGGDMVGETIHSVRAGVPYTAVRATRGKTLRAEPVAGLHEQGRVHLMGVFPELEAQLTSWTVDATDSHDRYSPDRLDAMVWGLTALGLIGGQGEAFLAFWRGEIRSREREAVPSKPSPQDATAARQLTRLMRSGPKFNDKTASGITAVQRRCSHRWRGDYCVFCSLTRAAV